MQCESATNVQLFNLLNGNPDEGGIWTNPSDGVVPNGLFSGSMEEGDYTYTVSGPGSCPESSSSVMVEVAELGNPGQTVRFTCVKSLMLPTCLNFLMELMKVVPGQVLVVLLSMAYLIQEVTLKVRILTPYHLKILVRQ